MRGEVLVRAALVQKYRLSELYRELELRFEGLTLLRSRREITIVVEGRTHRPPLLRAGERARATLLGVTVEGARVVRMHASGRA